MNDQTSGSGEYAPIPRDRYPIRCIEAEQTVSQSGTDMVEGTFEITGDNFGGRRIWDRFVWTQNTMWKVANILKAGESSLAEDAALSIDSFVRELNGGLSFSALVENDTYTNNAGEKKTKSVMKNYAVLSGDDASSENEMFR